MTPRCFAFALCLVFSCTLTCQATEPTGTAIEFYNSTLKHYFITAFPEEATGIDQGTAGPGWSRTGGTFGCS